MDRIADLDKLPKDPGCYLFRDHKGIVLYVGKAKQLSKRVSSYFQKKSLDPKTEALLAHAASVDYIITDNEKEALILENNLIKEYRPRYNIDLKDARRYAYLLLTNETFPRLILSRQRKSRGNYFGPFVSARHRATLQKFVHNTFRLRTCRKLPKRACLRYHMKLCDAPCINKISKEDYLKQVEKARTVLSGRTDMLLKTLHTEMERYAENKDYEFALRLRDQIQAIEDYNVKQHMETKKQYDQDIIHYVIEKGKIFLAVFKVYKGTLTKKNEYTFDKSKGFFEAFLQQYYHDEAVPKEIILPQSISGVLRTYLEERRGGKVMITLPKRGEKRKLLALVKKNLEKTTMKDDFAQKDLQQKLNLPSLPRVIECFDISHLSGSDVVGSMVCFKQGKPEKSGYRRFKIRTLEGVNDTAAIAEVVRRRYSRLKREEQDMPDLIVLDGGKGQLNAALRELSALELKIPAIALAKRMEQVYFPGLSVPRQFSRSSPALQLLQRARDEAHRFAVSYQKILRRKRVLGEE